MSDSESIPSDIEEEAFRAISGLLPARSKQKYNYTLSMKNGAPKKKYTTMEMKRYS